MHLKAVMPYGNKKTAAGQYLNGYNAFLGVSAADGKPQADKNHSTEGKKMKKKLLSVLLALIMLLCLVPAASAMELKIDMTVVGQAELTLETESGDSIDNVKDKIKAETGISAYRQVLYYNGKALEDGRTLADYNIQKGSTVTLQLKEFGSIFFGTRCIEKYDTVYYGVYSDGTRDYDVPWYALNADGFMLSKYTIGTSKFREDDGFYNYSVEEEKVSSSLLKDAMDALYDGENTLFTAHERAAVRETTLPPYGMVPTVDWLDVPDVNAHLFPLSHDEADVLAQNNDKSILRAESITDPGAITVWWLRSVFTESCNFVFLVEHNGFIVSHSDWGYIGNTHGVRPAFNLKLNSVSFTSAAEGGKSAGGMDGGLTAVPEYTGTDWKLTLQDTDRTFAVTETDAAAKAGDTVTLHYSGATVGENEYISVLIGDGDGNVTHYGRVLKPTAESGTVNVAIPEGLADGTYTLYVFSEQYNGDRKTDYASSLNGVTLTVEGHKEENADDSSEPSFFTRIINFFKKLFFAIAALLGFSC